jgi:hypothetical protein
MTEGDGDGHGNLSDTAADPGVVLAGRRQRRTVRHLGQLTAYARGIRLRDRDAE